MVKQEHKVATPSRSSKRTKGSHAVKCKRLSPDTEGSDGQAKLALACKPLRVGIPEEDKEVDRLRANLKKMGCAGLVAGNLEEGQVGLSQHGEG
jgi:hypothetical protein